ncbi:predicted protein [Postia placenta Mad-698-R]|nr:predicted protein [Postia placenta Mad-698-R]
MALGSPSPSSSTSVPSSTGSASSTSSAASSPSSSNETNSSPFSQNGTPALILAFLAIGLFIGGMLAMFGLRRRMAIRGPRRWFTSDPPPEALSAGWAVDLPEIINRSRSARRRQRDVGKKPDLWDVYAARGSTTGPLWRDIKPISAKIVCNERAQTLPSTAVIPPPPGEPGLFSHVSVDPLGFFRRGRSAPEAASATAPPISRRMEIAVAVAMPTPHRPSSEPFDYTLGLAVIPWNRDITLIEFEDCAEPPS